MFGAGFNGLRVILGVMIYFEAVLERTLVEQKCWGLKSDINGKRLTSPYCYNVPLLLRPLIVISIVLPEFCLFKMKVEITQTANYGKFIVLLK